MPEDPDRPPHHPAGCECGDYEYVNGHWVYTYNPECPIHR